MEDECGSAGALTACVGPYAARARRSALASCKILEMHLVLRSPPSGA